MKVEPSEGRLTSVREAKVSSTASLQGVEVTSLTSVRGIAALWVVLFHLNAWMPTKPLPFAVIDIGFVGVDIFFILSGYIIFSVYHDLRPSHWKAFFLRRVFRLYPLHVAIMLVLAIHVLLTRNPSPGFSEYFSWSAYLPVLLLVHPLIGIYHRWSDPSWSIGVELVCYFMFALAAPLLRSVRGVGGVVIGLVSVCASALAIYMLHHWANGHLQIDVAGPFAVLRGASAFLVGCMIRIFLAPSVVIGSRFDRVLGGIILHRLGVISYSIYLLHAPIISAARHLAGLLEKQFPRGAANELASLFAVLSTIVMAEITYRLVERPGREMTSIFLKRSR